LIYESRYKEFKGKLMTRWLVPYLVENFHENDSFQIRKIDEEVIPLVFKGYWLKIYKRPLSKEKLSN